MKKELREKIIAYNQAVKEKAKKASDMEVMISALASLPHGQLKKLLTDDIIAILAKYGVELG